MYCRSLCAGQLNRNAHLLSPTKLAILHNASEEHLHFLYQPNEIGPALKNGVRRWLRNKKINVESMKQSLWTKTIIAWLKYCKHETPTAHWTSDTHYSDMFDDLSGGEEAKENQLNDRENKKRRYARQQKHSDINTIKELLDNTTAKSIGQLLETCNEDEEKELFSIPGWKDLTRDILSSRRKRRATEQLEAIDDGIR
ncbi:Uncharacterised protein at_DN0625 [Pycnogonum litorale]